MKTFLLLSLLAAAAVAPANDEHQPRTLGNKAVMHLYWYAPKTLEVTYVDSFLFKDEAACKAAINAAMAIAVPTASEGDLITVTCVGIHPPEHPKDKGNAHET